MYAYDLFISYRREAPGGELLTTPWLDKVVHRVTRYLGEELGGRDPDVFFDVKSVELGTQWPARLREALLRSKCLLAIWTPRYFQSRWCLAEWESFVAREQIERDAGRRWCRLVLPVCAFDGVHYPRRAQDTQQFDLRRYYATTRAFWDTTRADELDQRLAELAGELATAIRQAPDYRADWPVKLPEPPPEPGSGMLRL